MADNAYPGDEATPEQVRAFAAKYEEAARQLLARDEGGKWPASAPFRLTALHSIELYLSAYLRGRGYTSDELRSTPHDLGARAKLAIKAGLRLRKRTADHLVAVTAGREYLQSRYEPKFRTTKSPPNQLLAALDDVANKVKSATLKSQCASVPLTR